MRHNRRDVTGSPTSLASQHSIVVGLSRADRWSTYTFWDVFIIGDPRGRTTPCYRANRQGSPTPAEPSSFRRDFPTRAARLYFIPGQALPGSAGR